MSSLHFVHLDVVDSTQNHAKTLLLKSNFVCVLTDRQTQGRGRSGNSWQSDEKDFICSVGFRLPFAVDKFIAASLAAGAVAIETFNLGTMGVRLKWPNDLIHGDTKKKLGGILIESSSTPGTKESTTMTVGIGINFAVVHSEKPSHSIGLEDLSINNSSASLSPPYSFWAEKFSHRLYEAFMQLGREGFSDLRARWESLSVHNVGDVMTIQIDDQTAIKGSYQGISDLGMLVLATSEGVKSISSGHVESW